MPTISIISNSGLNLEEHPLATLLPLSLFSKEKQPTEPGNIAAPAQQENDLFSKKNLVS